MWNIKGERKTGKLNKPKGVWALLKKNFQILERISSYAI